MSHHHGLVGVVAAAVLMLVTSTAIAPAVAGNWATAAAPAIVKDPQPPSVGRLQVSFSTPRDAQPTHVDLGAKGMGPGDQLVVTDLPMHADNGAQVGTWEGVEAILDDAHHGSISDVATLHLRDGRVMVTGDNRCDATPMVLAVVGGTGPYRAACGQPSLLVDDGVKGMSRYRLTLVPGARCLSTR